jgi:hypothetical protein
MDSVKVYNAEGAVFSERDLSLTELPPIPQHVIDEVTELGGNTHGKPNVRIVSGLDPSIVEWIGGGWWRVYASREHNPREYAILHRPDGSKKILTTAEASVYQKSSKLEGIIIPVKEDEITEHGIPRYFVEYYKPAEYFGSEAAWEEQRWIPNPEGGPPIDLMGEFPSEGRYETWFCIETAEEDEDGNFTGKTSFREIDDVALEYIKEKISEAKVSSAAEQHLKNRRESEAQMEQMEKKLKDDIADIVADRVDRLID